MMRITLLVVLSLLALQGCVQQQFRSVDDKDKAAEIYSDLGLGYLRQGKLDLAKQKLDRALELNNKQIEAHHYIAEVYKQLEEYELAEKHYTQALSINPKDPGVLNNYGAFLCQRSRFEDAEKHFLQVVTAKRYRTPELAYENLALCALRTDNVTKAEEYFRKALGINDQLSKSLFQMSNIHLDKKDYLRSRAFLQRYHDIASPTEQSLKLGIKIEESLGDKAARQEYVDKLKRLFPHVDVE
ncbi:type IV pilus biogenesis/stability protein PilW [Pseudomonadota bacterium]